MKKFFGIFIMLAIIVAFLLGYTLKPSSPEKHPAPQAIEAEARVKIWTCAMDPQIKLPKPGKCPICSMDLVPVKEEETEHPRRLTMSETAKALAEIQTAPVVRKSIIKTLRMVGKVEYDERRLAHITAWVPGRIDRLYVNYTGILVEKGDPMVYLYSPELVSTQEELLQAMETERRLKKTTIKGALERAISTREAAEKRLRLWGLTLEQIEEIKHRGEVVDHLTIHAPVGGVVIHKCGFEGQYVKTGTRLYTIADLSVVWVLLDAYESDMIWVHQGQEVEFTTEAYPGEIFRGRIAFIDPFLNEKTRTIKLRVEVPNPEGRLRPGMFVRAKVKACLDALGEKPLVIPASAPLITGKRAVVYVEVPNTDRPTYEGRVVELGPRADEYYVVKSGLQEGEMVVVHGNFKIDSALQIMAKPSMMHPEELTPTRKELQAPNEFRKTLSPLLTEYLEIQRALASDNLTKARAAFRDITHALTEIDTKLLNNEAHMMWMELSRMIESASSEALAADDIDGVRHTFSTLSDAIIEVIKAFGHAEPKELYEFHCSMALEGKGASWIQDTEEVANPYYGAIMLRCGVKRGKL
jgi:Cu(I)/Ag(I) efflux system membrane fusion protein